MHPWPQGHILIERPITDMRDRPRMDQAFPGIERLFLAHGAQILLRVVIGDSQWLDAEPGADGERRLIRGRAVGGRIWRQGSFAESRGWRGWQGGQRGAAGDAE